MSARALDSRNSRPAGRGSAVASSGTLEGQGRSLPFAYLAAKVSVPPSRPGAVGRNRLVNRLRAKGPLPVAMIVAPAGYGKTTLLGPWAG
jgi:hypothetical protein